LESAAPLESPKLRSWDAVEDKLAVDVPVELIHPIIYLN
jgi:hypothetical protein